MSMIGPYEITATLGTNGRYLIYRAKTPRSSEKYLIKTLRPNEIEHGDFAQLQHECALLQRLGSHEGHFPSVIGWVEKDNPLNLILKDEGFIFLNEALTQKPIDLAVFFPIAIKLTKMLTEIHNAGIIFKNINPRSIWLRPTDNAVQIADFSIATELNRTMVPSDPPRLLQGSLEYIAPEQTGRMNRPLTQAADLYSLGILFYEYLSGNVPFTGTEPMTIIFGHMATLPKDLHDCDNTLPRSLCAIVMKLLSKMSEDRYKSALGLTVDLEHAFKDWEEGKGYEVFPLGLNDIATRLELPSRLYGREAETKILFDAFDTLCENKKNALITVSGYSGVGKTSLVRELVPRIALKKGFLAPGKFDKFQQSDTYEGLRQALDKLVRYQLSLPEEEYEVFKNTLLEQMGGILKVITDFVPRLKIIVGEPEALPEVGIEATKNRFELAIQRFIKLVAEHHPLVLFLEDMQWANASLFDLLRKLVLSVDIQNILVIVSYRSNEVTSEHPFISFLNIIESQKLVQKIILTGLTKEALSQLLENMLYLPATELKFLTELMEQKTDGNPFFLLMLLEDLYREGYLAFSLEKKRWVWDEKRITQMSLTDNVLDFVSKRIAKLEDDTKDCLHLAACIGGTFNLEDLALAQKESASLVIHNLQPALQESLMVPTQLKDEWSEGVSEAELLKREYRFQHDKIQQACYELKPTEETKKIHLELARRWASSYKSGDADTRVMAIANQFNKGLLYVVDAAEKRKIAEFNYEAAQIALQSAAYDISYQYGSMAKSLLPETAWKTDYDFCFKVYFAYIQSAFLSRHFDEAAQTAEESLAKIKTNLEKARLLKLKGDLNRATGAPGGGMIFFEEALRLLGYPDIAKKPSTLDLLRAAIRFKWYLKYRLTPLENLPLNATEKQLFLSSTTLHLGEEAYYVGDRLRYAYMVMVFSIRTYAEQTQNLRAAVYLYNAMLFPQSPHSHALYQHAIPIMESSAESQQKASFYFAGSVLHAAWHEPWLQLVDNCKKAVSMSEKVGDLEFVSFSVLYQLLFDTQLSLSVVLKKIYDFKPHIQEASPRAAAIFDMLYRYTLNLSGNCAFNSWQDSDFDEKTLLSFFKTQSYALGFQYSYIFKLKASIHLDDLNALQNNSMDLESVLSAITQKRVALLSLWSHLYLFLAKMGLYPTLSGKQKVKTHRQLCKLYRAVKSWVKFCPENFTHCEILMHAELAGFKGDLKKTLKLYDEAIALATEHQVPEIACLAALRALKLCFAKNNPGLTYQYANKAVNLYAEWGAFGVVQMLQEKYALYLTPESKVLSAQKELSKEDYNARYGLDARSIILATRVINKSMQLGALLGNVMQLLIENIAATRGALCLMLKGEFWIEAYYGGKETGIQTLTHTPWKEAKISQEVFLQTWREKKEILIMDVSKSEEFQGSSYLQESEAKSLISVPIFNADGNEVIGVIYCENKLSTDSFTTDRLMVLRALSIQMSIFIDNSRLYTLFERFVPKPFLNQLGQENIFDLDAGDSVSKDMNVLFMDIRNFTGYSEKYKSEAVFQFINDYLLEVTPLIHSHNGFIDKFLGDGIMALFPGESREALRACVEMQRKIADFARSRTDVQLEVGMGLHYGPLMLGIVGEATHIEGTVIGDTVNVASRLEALNKLFKTQCLISDAVKSTLSIEEHYHLRPVGKIILMGRAEAMTVWQLLDSIRDETDRALHIEQLPLFDTYYEAYLQRAFKVARLGFEALLKDNPNDGVLIFYTETCRHYEQTPPPADWQAEIEMQFK
jgi:predicted ATPase/class 3 adenylate cyclase